jgi:hypothetical protein
VPAKDGRVVTANGRGELRHAASALNDLRH